MQFTLGEAARQCGVAKGTISKAIKTGKAATDAFFAELFAVIHDLRQEAVEAIRALRAESGRIRNLFRT